MENKTMITIPVGYITIPITERDAYIGTISTLNKRIERLVDKVNYLEYAKSELFNLCQDEYSSRTNPSMYLTIELMKIAPIFGFTEKDLKGDKEDGEETV